MLVAAADCLMHGEAEKSAYRIIVFEGRRPQMTFGPLTWNKNSRDLKLRNHLILEFKIPAFFINL